MGSYLFSIFLVMACALPVQAAFASLPDSARPYGMGSAFSAMADDFNSIFYNPAGLARMTRVEIGGNLGRLLSGTGRPVTSLFAAGAIPLRNYKESWDSRSVGFYFHRTGKSGTDSITNIGAAFGGTPQEFIPDKIFNWKLPTRFLPPDRFHAGSTIKIKHVNHPQGGTDSGLGLDFGFLYTFEESVRKYRNGWSLALVIQELNTTNVSGPVRYRLGSAWKQEKYSFSIDLLAEGGETEIMPGGEVSLFNRLLMVRAGTGLVPGKPRQLVLGVGTLLPPIQLDLAYGFPYKDFGEPNDQMIVSFTYRFGSPFLSQYLDRANQKRTTQVENSLANLEYKRESLKAGIRELKKVYSEVDADLRRAKSRTNKTRKDTRELDESIKRKEKEIKVLDANVMILHNKIKKMESKQVEFYEKNPYRLPGDRPRKHRVMKGDTLRGLAEKYYGDADKWLLIYEANEHLIKRGVPVKGKVLLIPPIIQE